VVRKKVSKREFLACISIILANCLKIIFIEAYKEIPHRIICYIIKKIMEKNGCLEIFGIEILQKKRILTSKPKNFIQEKLWKFFYLVLSFPNIFKFEHD
jgi:hypothetical protein